MIEKKEAISKLSEWLYSSKNEILRLAAIEGFYDLVNDDLATQMLPIIKNDENIKVRLKLIELLSVAIGRELLSKDLSLKIVDDYFTLVKEENNFEITKEIIMSINNHFLSYYEEFLQILMYIIHNYDNEEVIKNTSIAFQFFRFGESSFQQIVKTKIVATIKHDQLDSIKKYYLCFALGYLGYKELGYEILLGLHSNEELSDHLINQYKKRYGITLDQKISEIKEKAHDEGSKLLLEKIKEIEMEIKQKDEDIQLAINLARKTFDRYNRSIKENDIFISQERKYSLQTQIDYVRDELKYLKNRADEKITIKDEFKGAWKVISFFGILLGAIGTIASIVLIILKIIEVTR